MLICGEIQLAHKKLENDHVQQVGMCQHGEIGDDYFNIGVLLNEKVATPVIQRC
jgi:hypothetical protein